MTLLSPYRTRRGRVHHPSEEILPMPTPIITRISVAAAVAALRVFDAKDRTNTAITEVAEALHLSPETVAEIARNESHELALFEDQRRDQADAEARNSQPVEA